MAERIDDLDGAPDRTATVSPVGTAETEAGQTARAMGTPRPEGTRDGAYRHLVSVDAGHYAIGEEISRGGMGRICVATDRRLDRKVAIKEVLRDHGELARRFEREARITARLQHPSIVAVHEAGEWSTGTAFYAMPYIEGQSLDEALRRARSPEQRLALVHHVVAVADAMAYAHRHGVIHRDLKPKNVMIGPFGETVVIDWGLAKELRERDGVLAEGSGEARPSPGTETEHDVILGTAAYMPPEQANGPDVDERADVYALGAILYEVLAGRSAYSGSSADDVLAQVRRGPPSPLRSLAPEVPVDLAAIVGKAMARDPADRYANGAELAEDLRRFQTGLLVTARHHSAGERLLRWARRHRVVLASAATVVVVAAVLAVLAFTRVVEERDRAEAQRTLALAERSAAEQLVDFVLVDLRGQLTRLGKLEPMFGVGAEVDRYYERLASWRGDRDPEAMRRRAQALEVLGDVQDARGEHDRAAAAYRSSLELRRSLLVGDRGQRPLVDVARTLTRLGQTLGDVRDGEALVELEQARRMIAPLRAGTIDGEAGVAIAEVLAATGDRWLKRGELARARSDYREAIDVLARPATQDLELRAMRARCHDRLGTVAMELGEHAGALAEFTTQLGLAEQLAAEEPTPQRRAAVEIAHAKLARALEALGRLDDAEAHHASSLAIARQLVAIDPSNIDWWHALASSASDAGTLRLERKDLAGAQDRFVEAYDAIVRVAAADRDHQRWQRHVAVALSKLGQVKQDRGDLPGALADFQRAVDILTKAVALDPENAVARQHLAIGHSYVGEVQRARKDLDAALASFQAMIAAVQEAAQRGDDRGVAFTKILAVGHGLVASVHEARPGEAARAIGELDVAIKLLERLKAASRIDAEGTAYLAEFEHQRTAIRGRAAR